MWTILSTKRLWSMKKIISLLGFARKSNNLIIGQSSLKRFAGHICLIMLCSTATENLKNLAKNLSEKHHCPIIETKVPLETLSNIEGVKILGITDENLAKGIILNKESVNIG